MRDKDPKAHGFPLFGSKAHITPKKYKVAQPLGEPGVVLATLARGIQTAPATSFIFHSGLRTTQSRESCEKHPDTNNGETPSCLVIGAGVFSSCKACT
jgi:hypothetical protein